MKKFEGNFLRAITADCDYSIDAQLARVGNNLIVNVAHNFLAVLDGTVAERIAPVGGAENRSATRQNAAHIFERELVRFFRPDQAIEAIRNADHLPLVFEKSSFDRSANDGVEAGSVAAPGANADAADRRHVACYWRVTVKLS